MKLKYIHKVNLLLVAIVLLISACYKDKGNYDYETINSITVTDSAAASKIYLFHDDTLKLNPTVNQTLPTSDLSYLWFVYNNSTNSAYNLPRDTIATTKNLSHIIKSDIFVLGEVYKLTLKVTDNITGVSSFILYDLEISNKYGTGWLLLENNNDKGDFSMVLPNNTAERNLYSLLNTGSTLGKPVSITSSPFSVTDDLSTPNRRIYIQTENDAIELNNLTLTKKFDIGYLFFAKPQIVKPGFIGWTGYLSGTTLYQRIGLAVNNGLVHTNMVGGFPGIKKWGEALPNPDGKYDYEVAPFFAGATIYSPTYTNVVYDKKYKRFYSIGTNALVAFSPSAGTHFDFNNVGLDFIALDSSNITNQYNAVLKDGSTAYLLQFKTVAATGDPVVSVGKTLMNAAGIATATSVASSTITPHIFYSAANELYRYESTSNTYLKAYSFAANENVTAIDYQKFVPGTGNQRLVVATWNGTEGKFYYFDISTLGTLSTNYTNVFTGFKKIIDIAYKY
ncbi:PKD-like family lipoprotein [Polluticaenibacter yanchengensis]|uniref:PKD-like family lipoprotein n=1 Tax=Polluticaenibacter yanchengensis TaxID=3014562 RepID=A0ABT4UNW9_9BACT|nr:PKD-like family lipoprotein [Chitinophagaceae bacterium LY-5]